MINKVTKKTIFMIHGAFSSKATFTNMKKFFKEKGYECIAPNLPFHGKQEDIDNIQFGKTSFLHYVASMEKEINKLGTKPIIIGHSMGGIIAQKLASKSLAAALVLLAPAPKRGDFTLRKCYTSLLIEIFTKWNFWNKIAKPSFKKTARFFLFNIPEQFQKPFYDSLGNESGRVLFEVILWFFDFNKATKVEIDKIKCPVLIVAADQDSFSKKTTVKKLAGKYSKHTDTTYKEYTNRTHLLTMEPGWQDIAQDVADWLDHVISLNIKEDLEAEKHLKKDFMDFEKDLNVNKLCDS